MSILDSYDIESKAMIEPSEVIPKSNRQIDTCIITYSGQLIYDLEKMGIIRKLNEIHKIGSANGEVVAYLIKDTNIAIYKSAVGSPMTVVFLEEFHQAIGIKNVIAFGSCGALTNLEAGKCILPSEAYRDEGTSYHYAPPSDYIQIKNADILAKYFDTLHVGYVKGKTWTTDAFYRETENNKNKRKAEGCICVEMECSALQAVCDFRNIQLYQFLYSADSLEGNSWNQRILGNHEMDARHKYFYLALELAKMIEKDQSYVD